MPQNRANSKGYCNVKRHKMAFMEVCLDSYDLSTYPENSQIKLALTKHNYASDIMPYKTLYPKIYRIRQSVISNPKTLLHLPPLCPHFSELPLTPHLNVYQGWRVESCGRHPIKYLETSQTELCAISIYFPTSNLLRTWALFHQTIHQTDPCTAGRGQQEISLKFGISQSTPYDNCHNALGEEMRSC